jgi:hypothetical protein
MRRKPPNRTATRKPAQPVDQNWRGMTPERLRLAASALSCDAEDVTDEEMDALSEYLVLGGNPQGL